jgi:predicted nucleic acid-binding protein
VRVVVTDTGPLNYLVLIGAIDILPKLFNRVVAPQTVGDELAAIDTPAPVRAWVRQAPDWFEFCPDAKPGSVDGAMKPLDAGERAVIDLAIVMDADLILMDDRGGVSVARQKNLAVTGTLGILDLAARQGLLDLTEAFVRLKTTSFYYRQGLLDQILARHRN